MIDRNLMIDALTSDGMFPAMLTRGEAEKMSDEELYKKFLELERMEQGKEVYDQQKETHGKFATFVWIASGIYLFASSDEISLISWQAAIFIFVGMFFAALVFGILGYVIQRGIAKILIRTTSGPPTGAAASAIGILGLILMLLEALMIFYSAGVVFGYFV
jgi:hypothetical protein